MVTDFDLPPATLGDPEYKKQQRTESFERNEQQRAEATAEKAADFVEPPKRTKTAKDYEQKTSDILRFLMSLTAQSPKTVADAAAIITYGDAVSEKMGDLAAEDARVRRALDFINGGTDNPYLDVAIVALPLIMQIVRNHEPEAEVKGREFRIPFIKRTFRLKFRFKLRNKVLRSMTEEPKLVAASIFTNTEIMDALKAQGVNVAYPS